MSKNKANRRSQTKQSRRRRQGTLDKRSFAMMMANLIHRAGDPNRPRYDAETFSLVGREEQVLRLANAYEEYERLPSGGREQLLRNWTCTWFRGRCELPSSFDEAQPDLLPVVRRRGTHVCELLEQKSEEKRATPRRVFGGHFSVGLGYDWPECMFHVSEDQLSIWGVGFDQAFEAAVSNLRAMSKEPFIKAAPGFYFSPWHDSYDSARILVPELFDQCEIKGSPVVMLPHQDLLVVTGSEDDDGLDRMASLVEEKLAGSRFLSGIPLILGHDWSPFELPRSHFLSRRYQSHWHLTLATDYSRQGELLTAQNPELPFVAAVFATPGSLWSTTACWTEGVDTVLPKTEIVVLLSVSQDVSCACFHAAGEWDRVKEVVGDLMKPVGLYPERYRVRSFPTLDQLEAIKGNGPDLLNMLRQRGAAIEPCGNE
jgi:Protein of unknown function (DUF1444)